MSSSLRSILPLLVLVAAILAITTSAVAFSDNELKGIYSQMKPSVRCGMTEAYFVEKYRGCAEESGLCDASLNVTTAAGLCVDSLQFRGLTGTEAAIIFNGQTYPKPVPVVPHQKKGMDVNS